MTDSKAEIDVEQDDELKLLRRTQDSHVTYWKFTFWIVPLLAVAIFARDYSQQKNEITLILKVDELTNTVKLLIDKYDSLSTTGNPRTLDRLDSHERLLADHESRLRRVERHDPKNVSTNTNIVSVDASKKMTKPMLTTRELAELEGVNSDTIRRRINAGQYTAVKDGSEYRIENPYLNMPTVRAMPETGMNRALNVQGTEQ